MTAALCFYDRLLLTQQAPRADLSSEQSGGNAPSGDVCMFAAQLGDDPRPWTSRCGRMAWWRPGYTTYSKELRQLLLVAAESEQRAIETY